MDYIVGIWKNGETGFAIPFAWKNIRTGLPQGDHINATCSKRKPYGLAYEGAGFTYGRIL